MLCAQQLVRLVPKQAAAEFVSGPAQQRYMSALATASPIAEADQLSVGSLTHVYVVSYETHLYRRMTSFDKTSLHQDAPSLSEVRSRSKPRVQATLLKCPSFAHRVGKVMAGN